MFALPLRSSSPDLYHGKYAASLFAAGEQGVWYDSSDLSTMFQDAAGTTPVTAVEQPVGRILDKSGRGNHATQTTTASRPVLSARVNLLLSTETLATQSVTTAATTQRLRFEGTGSITLSGTATGTYSAGSHTFSTTAGTLTLTVSGSVTKADLRAANDALNQPAYQRVNTSTDYDTAGFPYYLRFDGVDDSLVTPSIDFTSTDKMTVFAGVRKLSDAAGGYIVLLYGTSGTFTISGPDFGYSNKQNYGFNLYGSSNAYGALVSYTSPISNVLTASYDISGNTTAQEISVKVNQLAQSLTSSGGPAGTGNFGNWPLVIGRPLSWLLPFNGRLYGLVVRGAETDDLHLTNVERYLANKSGVLL